MTIDGNDMKSDSGFVSKSPFILYVTNGFVWGGALYTEREYGVPNVLLQYLTCAPR